jgi:hypothetical protein
MPGVQAGRGFNVQVGPDISISGMAWIRGETPQGLGPLRPYFTIPP